MLQRVKKLQLLCGLLLLLQIFIVDMYVPFHLLASLLSIIIIGWHFRYRAILVQYHYYVIVLYGYRIWLFYNPEIFVLDVLYLILLLYISIIIILCSIKAIL